MTYAAAEEVIRRYLNENLPEPQHYWNKTEFEARTYSRWAANELLARIMEEELKLPYHISGLEQKVPVEVAQEFVYEMDLLWELTNDKRRRFMYATASHTADEILSKLYF